MMMLNCLWLLIGATASNWNFDFFQSNNTPIRYLHINGHKKTVLFLHGRSGFIEKNTKILRELEQAGFDVWAIELRGHGASGGRIERKDQRVHIQSFDDYINDLDNLLTNVIKKPVIIIGSSLGGHIALRYAQTKPSHYIESLVLIAPMIDVTTKPFPRSVAPLIIRALKIVGREKTYAPGYGPFDPLKEKDPDMRTILLNNRDYVTGGPTVGWVSAMFESIQKLKTSPAPKAPLTIFCTRNDKIVDNTATQTYLPPSKYKYQWCDGSHNLLHETKNRKILIETLLKPIE